MKEFNTNNFVTMTDDELVAVEGGKVNFLNYAGTIGLSVAFGAITGGPAGAAAGMIFAVAAYRY